MNPTLPVPIHYILHLIHQFLMPSERAKGREAANTREQLTIGLSSSSHSYTPSSSIHIKTFMLHYLHVQTHIYSVLSSEEHPDVAGLQQLPKYFLSLSIKPIFSRQTFSRHGKQYEVFLKNPLQFGPKHLLSQNLSMCKFGRRS